MLVIGTGQGSAHIPGARGQAALTATIGFSLPITGSEASFGNDMRNAGALAASQAKGIKIKIVTEDDACDPQTSVNAANRLVTGKVNMVVGYYCSGAALPASTIYHRSHTPVIFTGALNPQITQQGFPEVFRTIGTSTNEALIASKFIARKLHGKSVALIHDNTAYGKGLADATATALHQFNIRVALETAVTTGAKDFGATVSRIIAAKPSVTYYTAYYPEGSLLLKQLYEAKYKGTLMAGSGNEDPAFIKIAGEKISEKIIFTSPALTQQIPAAKTFIKQYRSRFGKDPGGYAVFQYDGVRVAIDALKRAHSTDPNKIIAALRATHFRGIAGPIAFNKNGQVKKAGYTELVVRNGQFVLYKHP